MGSCLGIEKKLQKDRLIYKDWSYNFFPVSPPKLLSVLLFSRSRPHWNLGKDSFCTLKTYKITTGFWLEKWVLGQIPRTEDKSNHYQIFFAMKSFEISRCKRSLSSHCGRTVGSWRTVSTCIESIWKRKKKSLVPCGYNRMWTNQTEIPPLQILSSSALLEGISMLSGVRHGN